MVSVGQEPNIELLSYSDVEEISGFIGNFKVKVRRKSRYVETNCTGCGECVEPCPVKCLDVSDDTVRVEEDWCIGCGVCIDKCSTGAARLVFRPVRGDVAGAIPRCRAVAVAPPRFFPADSSRR